MRNLLAAAAQAFERRNVFSTNISNPGGYFLYRRRLCRYSQLEKTAILPDVESFANTVPSAKDKSRADEIEAQNASTNTLQLPPELIICIADFMAPADLLSFRASCRYFAALTDLLVKRVVEEDIEYAARDEIALRLHADRFDKILNSTKYQRNRKRERGEMICSHCLDFHPLSSFSEEEAAKGPTERKCTDAIVKFYMCPHKGLTFRQLHAISRNLCSRELEDQVRFLFCREPTCSGLSLENGTISTSTFQMRRFGTFRFQHNIISFLSSSSCSVQELPYSSAWAHHHTGAALRSLEVSRKQISSPLMQSVLVQLDTYICPHLRTSDDYVYERLQQSACEDFSQHDEFLREGRSLWPTDTVEAVCGIKECGASFELSCFPRLDKFEEKWKIKVELQIERVVDLTTVRDRSWLAKTERSG